MLKPKIYYHSMKTRNFMIKNLRQLSFLKVNFYFYTTAETTLGDIPCT